MTVAVLAVQGAFIEHEQIFEKLGVSTIELRKQEDLKKSFDALVLPGGESTTQRKLLKEFGMFDELKRMIQQGMPVFATCAGMILLADKLSNDNYTGFQTLPVTVKRNAYGRQLGSFYTEGEIKGIGTVPMTFIRAPYIECVGKGVEILARVDGNIVAVQYQNQIALSFHPEVTDCIKVHEYFLTLCKRYREQRVSA